MRALLTSKPGQADLISYPEPVLSAPDEVILRIERVGLCGSDQHHFQGDLGAAGELYPRITGHEVSAVIEQAGKAAGEGLTPGQRVAVLPVFACGGCYPCRAGRPNVCARLAVLGMHRDGALADLMAVPAANVVPVAPGVPPEAVAFMEPAAVAVHAVRRGRLAPGEHVVIFGAGPIGQACCLAAAADGAAAMLVDPSGQRCEAATRTGADAVYRGTSAQALAAIADWCGGEAPEVIMDTTGDPAAFRDAVAAVIHGGRVVAVGLTGRQVCYSYGILAHHELDVLGVSCCTADDFRRAAGLVAGAVDRVMPLITDLITLADVAAALPRIGGPGVMKIAVDLTAG
ncbi:MAG: alcohol dehydrogenase catalytic domain-containing protein [Actinobacteria bacterium]|nr:alcohol dehydrogenase catalytic domain-containing protein [Actinomycetota bacterium]